MSVEIATLRTGAEVPAPLVITVIIALKRLMSTAPVAFYEAVELARNPDHVPFGNAGQSLEGLLLDHGVMHGATRDVILAATDAKEGGLHLVSPFAATEATA